MNGNFNDDPLKELSEHAFMKMLNKVIGCDQHIVDLLDDDGKTLEEITNYLKLCDDEVRETLDPYDWEV